MREGDREDLREFVDEQSADDIKSPGWMVVSGSRERAVIAEVKPYCATG